MDWREYEQEVFAELKSRYPAASIVHNASLPGRFSLASRQIDILIEETVGNAIIRVVVDAKHYESPIDVKDVESFLGVLADVNGHKGIMVSLKGYTAAALQRAWSDP